MQCTIDRKDSEQIVLAMLACSSFFMGSNKRLVSELAHGNSLVPEVIDFCLLAQPSWNYC